jgi:DNA-binding MltR family transcriptional regulator
MAIVTSIFVDNALKDAIAARLRKMKPQELSLIFEGNGPLATFSNRIRFGFALGIFGPKARNDLDLIRRIRNAFAHARRPLSFKTPQIIQLCDSFDLAPILKKQAAVKNEHVTEKARYVYSVTTMIVYVALEVSKRKDRRHKLKKPLPALAH